MHSRVFYHNFLSRLAPLGPPPILTRAALFCIIMAGQSVVGVRQAIAHPASVVGSSRSAATATAPPEFYVANIFPLQTPAQSQDSSPSADAIDPIFGRLVLQTQGALEDGDQIAFQDGSLYDEYPIEGISGQHLKISLESSEFDPYLILIGPNGNILARHDDISRDNFNATIDIVLPDNGSYRIIANGYSHYSQGRYTLSIHMTEPLGGEPLVGPSVPDHRNR